MGVFASRPNVRRYRLGTEDDCAIWFHTEVSNIVLSAWNATPDVLQTNQPKPRDTNNQQPEMVDVVYALAHRKLHQQPLAIGEWKRNIIRPLKWLNNEIEGKGSQANLSRELRGYAFKYKCPQVFCFDGKYLLLLQFQAGSLDAIKDRDCAVDCWILPRENEGGITLREGFYRLLAQGFRRCQGSAEARPTVVNGFPVVSHEFYSGRPLFRDAQGRPTYDHPQNDEQWVFDREVDTDDGSFYWRVNREPLFEGGKLVRDTKRMWGFEDDSVAVTGPTGPGAGPSTGPNTAAY